MRLESTKISKIELSEKEINTLWDAYFILFDIADLVRNEQGDGVITSSNHTLSYTELKKAMTYLNIIGSEEKQMTII